MSAPVRRRPMVLVLHLAAFLIGSLFWMVACGVVAAAWTLMALGVDAGGDPEALQEALGAAGMGVLTVIQIGGLAAMAAGLAPLVPEDTEPTIPLPGPDFRFLPRLRERLALGRPPGAFLVAGAIGATTIWTFPSWIAMRLMDLLPDYQGTLELITTLLQTGPVAGRAILAFSIIVTAPLFEELIFRAYLWSVLERALPPAAVFLGTSLLFAAYHLDPVHVVSLLPTALFLGWLRWASGSVWPSILAHFVNNGIATLAAVMLPVDSTDELGLVPSLLGLGVSISAAGLAWWLHRRSAA